MEPLHNPKPIATYMRRHGLSQQDFARRFGFSQSAVSQWLALKKSIGIRTAEHLEKRSEGEIRVRALYPRLFARAA